MKKQTGRAGRALLLSAALLAALAVPALAAEETGADPRFYQTLWSLLPPVVAIGLALATKEVYSSLFLGILTGGLKATAGGITAAIVFGLLAGILFKPKDKS